ncbi:hypothetical protein B0H19DRAFT_1009685 [Mycena capillaripes]|nr:hypothetical protein B0H19DRAFT_1009685 [Mycena capillaripes]
MSPAPPQDRIRFIVVGGSVAGLCAAYILRQSGHDVVVLDKRDERIESNGGLRVPPNMTRLLETLPGMKALLRTHGNECDGMTFVEGETSKMIGRMHFHPEAMKDLGCKFYMVPYDILIKHLLHICRQTGVQLKFRTEVASVHAAFGRRPHVVTIEGQRIEGDLLIGADGRDSIVRDTLTQQVEDDSDDSDSDSEKEYSAGVSEIVGASYSISMSVLRNDPELSVLAQSSQVHFRVSLAASGLIHSQYMVWPGSQILVTGHKVRLSPCSTSLKLYIRQCGPELYIVSVARVTGTVPTDIDSDWRPNAPFPDVEAQLAEFEPRVRSLVKAASHCHRTIQRIPAVRRIAHRPTGMVVIGDAAHTITIHETHNSSIAVEDGFALGRIFSHVTTRDQIPYLLQGYREVRYPRSMATEASELGAFLVITLPPGEARNMRNQQLAFSLVNMDDMPDDFLAAAWATYLVQFNYDANEAVDEWWLMGKFNMPHSTNGHRNGHGHGNGHGNGYGNGHASEASDLE